MGGDCCLLTFQVTSRCLVHCSETGADCVPSSGPSTSFHSSVFTTTYQVGTIVKSLTSHLELAPSQSLSGSQSHLFKTWLSGVSLCLKSLDSFSLLCRWSLHSSLFLNCLPSPALRSSGLLTAPPAALGFPKPLSLLHRLSTCFAPSS